MMKDVREDMKQAEESAASKRLNLEIQWRKDDQERREAEQYERTRQEKKDADAAVAQQAQQQVLFALLAKLASGSV